MVKITESWGPFHAIRIVRVVLSGYVYKLRITHMGKPSWMNFKSHSLLKFRENGGYLGGPRVEMS